MSWSINVVGSPENIVKAIEAESERQTGQCKTEFDAAKPHLIGLVQQNFATDPNSYSGRSALRLTASGSGSTVNGVETNRSCTISIERLGQLV